MVTGCTPPLAHSKAGIGSSNTRDPQVGQPPPAGIVGCLPCPRLLLKFVFSCSITPERIKMRTLFLLLLVGLTAIDNSCCGLRRRLKRELLKRSKRRWVLSTIELGEEDPGPYPKLISRMFNDMTGNIHEFQIKGMGVDLAPLGVFSIDPEKGFVYAHKPIDRETYSKPFHIQFDLLNKWTKKPMDRQLSFDVELQDINDNAPTFTNLERTVNVAESTPNGYLPVQLHFMDRDQPNTANSLVNLTMLSYNPKFPVIGFKRISDRRAQLTVEGCFDYDKVKKHEVTVQLKDHGTPSLSSTAVITLNVVDSNTHLPMFKDRQYQASVNESVTKDDILRVSVVDEDTPGSPAWRAVYYFIKGNEEGNYKIETDPETNEGILSVVKGKDYERSSLIVLQIGVKNEESIFVCEDKSKVVAVPPDDSVNITVRVIDLNDPPQFTKDPADVYHKEEEKPGKVLYTPEVTDVDSDVSQIRYVVLEDPAQWVTIDKNTGQVISAKKMDRESFYLNGTDAYKVLIGAIDNGEPPATGTGTVRIHLGDANDNLPQLVNKHVVLCGNKDKVMVPVKDADAPPFSGPFTFSLGGDDKTVAEQWKLEPAFGEEGGLVSQKPLPYGNYLVPLEIRDQQNMAGHETLTVIVCDCEKAHVCRSKRTASAGLGAAAIAVMVLGILLFLLLLLLFICDCGKEFKHIPMVHEEGCQTLIKYNQEGGVCKADPSLLRTLSNSAAVTDGLMQGTMQLPKAAHPFAAGMDTYNTSRFSTMNVDMCSMGMQRQRDTLRGQTGQSNYSKWTAGRSNTYGRSSMYSGALSMRSNQFLEDQLNRCLSMVDGHHTDYLEYKPHQYTYEGQSSRCDSLDRMSLSNLDNDVTFLNDLGPKFKTLGGICQPTVPLKAES
ncbi:cadherin-like protein 26 [Brachionichthys hirsutus]|uniref:cadherin-like protein 26 n=1 Tax=Brachionichthys hirsutus TaxID=412623 RepID=UPI003604DE35